MNRGQTTLDFAIGVSVFIIVVAFVLAFVPGMVQPFQASTQQETAAADRIAEQLAAGMLVEDTATPYVLDRGCTVIFFESRQDGNDPGGDDAENVDRNDDGFSDPFGAGSFSGSCNFPDAPFEERLAIAGSDFDVRISIVADLEVGELDSPDADSNDDFDAADPDDTDPDVLCIDENSENRIVEANDPFNGGTECDITGGDDDVAFVIGDEPPSSTSSVVVARRFVRFEGGFGDGNDEATLVVEVW